VRAVTRLLVLPALVAASVLAGGGAAAHTEADLVAVPAGGEATVTLRPTHGCGDSPTVSVLVRAPVEGARAEEVSGWTATSTPDGEGNTVLEWTGGSLPADQTGAFPLTFTVPDVVGELLTFPSVQRCASGEELAWIGGDPADEYPAPRLLVLPAGSEPAETIDDVPPDAPGRDQLTAVVDVDNPAAQATTTTVPATTTTAGPSTTATTIAAADDGAGDDGDGGTGWLPAVAVAALLAAAVGGGIAVVRRRSS
jgi:uncharacterized protein YcnI